MSDTAEPSLRNCVLCTRYRAPIPKWATSCRLSPSAVRIFSHLWNRHEITVNYDGDHKPIYHHELGPIDLYCQILFDSDKSQAHLAHTALPGTASSDVLKRMHHNTRSR